MVACYNLQAKRSHRMRLTPGTCAEHDGQVTCSGEKLLRFWGTTSRIRKSKFLIGQVFSQSNPFKPNQHSRIFYEMKFIYL